MKSVTCKIAVISDIHFGNGRVHPIAIYEHLQDTLYPIIPSVDMLLILGDTFDTLLNMNSDAGLFAAKFIDDIVRLCKATDTFIRVVRGTFSHDRYQNRFFNIRKEGQDTLHGIPLVKVIDRVSVEHISPLMLDLCYSPDDQPHQDLSQAIIDMLHTNHLESVDLLCSHGYYDHLLPHGLPNIPTNTIYYDRVSPYVRGMMLNGHVHKASVYQNKMISCGSYERLDFSNEEPTGFWILTRDDNRWSYEFIENPYAIPFKTFMTSAYSGNEELSSAISTYITNLQEDGLPDNYPIYLRIVGDPIGIPEWIRATYPNVIVSDKKTKSFQENYEITSFDMDELTVITEDNILHMIYDRVKDVSSLTYKDIEEIWHDL